MLCSVAAAIDLGDDLDAGTRAAIAEAGELGTCTFAIKYNQSADPVMWPACWHLNCLRIWQFHSLFEDDRCNYVAAQLKPH